MHRHTVHSNTPDNVLTQMLLFDPSAPVLPGGPAWRSYRNLENELVATVVGVQGVENGRELLGVELDCN